MKRIGLWPQTPAVPEALRLLSSIVPSGTPDDFAEFFRKWDGAEAAFESDDVDMLRVDSIEHIAQTKAALSEVFPTLFVFGTDGGGRLIAYDMEAPKPWPIVLHWPGVTDHEDPTALAATMSEFIQKYFEG
ncbi:MAG: SMI1/KNR4 family protein [Verrucomicrobiaceae bacterium]|nr:SMI1/KNR4 family protein [Verrucomicrobiaceae bacterium]